MEKQLIFSTSTELIRVPSSTIVFIVADGNYSKLKIADGHDYVITQQLGQIERCLAVRLNTGDTRFIRIGKSLIVNRDYISFIHVARQRLMLSDCRSFRHELSASKEALRLLKDLIEKEEAK